MKVSESTEILYDNASEPGFAGFRASRRRRLAAFLVILIAGLVVVAGLYLVPALLNGNPWLLGIWVAGTGFFAMFLLLLAVYEPGALHARATTKGIESGRRVFIPRDRLKEAFVEEDDLYIYIRQRVGEEVKPVRGILTSHLVDPGKFRQAVEKLIRGAEESG